MNKFIFAPFLVVAVVLLVIITLPFLGLHCLLKTGIKVVNFLLSAAGYEYRFFLDVNEVEK